MSHQDLALARRMLAGEEEAFDEFFGEHFPALYRFAMARMHHDADAAEEVAQATLCAAMTKLATYRGEAALLTWLCTFCRHEVSAFYRKRGRQQPVIGLVEEDPEVRAALDSLRAGEGSDPEAVLRRSELSRLVHVTLDHLPGSYARALEWKYIDGLPVVEIASRLHVSPKAAESLLTRAREAFRDGYAAMTTGRSPWAPALPERS